MYSKCLKRILDFVLALLALVVLFPIILILAIVGAIAMGGNPFFVQPRPGKKDKNGKETIFNLVKFRTMSNKKDKDGNLLPDELRLNSYGRFLRSTSLDELGELWNIIKGDMSIVGPRPQLVRDMVFMTEEQRRRHDVRPGLTGLAQVSGRNTISWDDKLKYDIEYINNISFITDVKIIIQTVKAVLMREDINSEGFATAEDYGDYLLSRNRITKEQYLDGMKKAQKLLERI